MRHRRISKHDAKWREVRSQDHQLPDPVHRKYEKADPEQREKTDGRAPGFRETHRHEG